jgi:hypothetical protein
MGRSVNGDRKRVPLIRTHFGVATKFKTPDQETIEFEGFEAQLTDEGNFLGTGDCTAKISAKSSS